MDVTIRDTPEERIRIEKERVSFEEMVQDFQQSLISGNIKEGEYCILLQVNKCFIKKAYKNLEDFKNLGFLHAQKIDPSSDLRFEIHLFEKL
jgi:hypothetical protein